MKKYNINIKMLKVLVSLRDTGSVSRTAEQLHVTQSAISHTVKALESTLDTQILIREARGVTLTAAGKSASESANVALAAINDILQLAMTVVSGTIQVATVNSVSRVILPEVLVHTRRNYPNIEVKLLIGTDQEVEQWVKSGIADIGIAYNLQAKSSELLIEDQFYLIQERGQSSSTNLALSDLCDKGFVMSSSGCEPFIQQIFEQSNQELNVKATVSDIGALFSIVSSGYGVSLVPGLAFPNDWNKQVMRQPMTPFLGCSLRMMSPETSASNEAVQVILGYIREVSKSIKMTS